jgi:hypothetical protein
MPVTRRPSGASLWTGLVRIEIAVLLCFTWKTFYIFDALLYFIVMVLQEADQLLP